MSSIDQSRRTVLKGLSLGAGSVLLSPMVQRVVANAEGQPRPPRFVFVLQSNGFDPIQACPESIPFQKYADREKFESIDLTQHKLPKGLAPLEPLKAQDHHCAGAFRSLHRWWTFDLGRLSRPIPNLGCQQVTPRDHDRLPAWPGHPRNSTLGRSGDGFRPSRRPDGHHRAWTAQNDANHPEPGKCLQRFFQCGRRGRTGKKIPPET